LNSPAGTGFVLVDKSDADRGLESSAFEVVEGSLTAGLSGKFNIRLAQNYTQLAIGLKTGSGQLDPDWAVFKLSPGLFTGLLGEFSWSVSGRNDLSHMNLYGIRSTVNVIPLPAAAWLLLGGVGVLGALKLRRERAA
jgi:hypothetical protein